VLPLVQTKEERVNNRVMRANAQEQILLMQQDEET